MDPLQGVARAVRGLRLAAPWLERALLTGGLASLGWVGYVLVDATFFQLRAASAVVEERPDVQLPAQDAPVGAVIGLLEAPEVGLDVVVVEGTTDRALRRAAGHLERSARPGEDGNVVIAGHRDTFFRPLAEIRRGHQILVRSRRGVDYYEVEWTRVVEPDRVAVVAPERAPVLTLITCYPFRYIGNAPLRFVVRARHLHGPASSPAVERVARLDRGSQS